MLLAAAAASTAFDLADALSGVKAIPSTAAVGEQSFAFQAEAAATAAVAECATSTGARGAPTAECGSNSGALSPETIGKMLQLSEPNPNGKSDPLKELLKLLDGDGDGTIKKAEYAKALGTSGAAAAKADAVFGKLDSNGDGAMSFDELSAAMSSRKSSKSTTDTASTMLKAMQGARATRIITSSGATTTQITYADGSIGSVTSAASPFSGTAVYAAHDQVVARQAGDALAVALSV